MNIEVGEYVRTEDGNIGKLVEINKNYLNYYKIDVKKEIQHIDTRDNYIYTRDGFDLKHSKNIIDLIELKDIVEIQNLVGEDISFTFEIFNEETMADFLKGIKDKEIKLISILTKEQYENNCYRLE